MVLLAKLFDEPDGLLGVVMPLAHGALQPGGDVDHGDFAVEGLAQIGRFVFGAVVGGAAAGGLAAAVGHAREAAVSEALGLAEALVEFAAAYLSSRERLAKPKVKVLAAPSSREPPSSPRVEGFAISGFFQSRIAAVRTHSWPPP